MPPQLLSLYIILTFFINRLLVLVRYVILFFFVVSAPPPSSDKPIPSKNSISANSAITNPPLHLLRKLKHKRNPGNLPAHQRSPTPPLPLPMKCKLTHRNKSALLPVPATKNSSTTLKRCLRV